MVRDRGDDDALIEELAAIEHERWSHWQRYVHAKAVRRPDGSLVLSAELVDREQVRRYLPVLKRWFQDDEERSG
jgi:hypothetical protein